MAGLTRSAQGRFVVAGEVWQDDGVFMPVHRRPVGYVFQDANLFAHLSVRRNLDYGRSRVPAAARLTAFEHAVELLGIGHLLERKPHGLSGGERQRVAIARALLTSPRLLLMDEPLAALDLARKNEFMPYLERLHRELDIPVVYVTHAPDEVARLADHLVAMDAGRVLVAGPLAQTLGPGGSADTAGRGCRRGAGHAGGGAGTAPGTWPAWSSPAAACGCGMAATPSARRCACASWRATSASRCSRWLAPAC